jgi:acyl-[acyl-carrier-protein]-phospholipid O-acyltransferase/long-chain-fatty-acid--[acyl-carrier-protein] ligase
LSRYATSVVPGCPECAPIISLNIPDFDRPGTYQRGTQPGTVGAPPPGITVRIADPITGAALGPGKEGKLLVSGPNIMQGYAQNPEATNDVLLTEH